MNPPLRARCAILSIYSILDVVAAAAYIVSGVKVESDDRYIWIHFLLICTSYVNFLNATKSVVSRYFVDIAKSGRYQ